MATRKKKTAKSDSLQVNSACSAETTINILFDQPLKVKAPVLGSMPEASNNSHKKQRLKKSLEKVYQDGASELRLQKLRALIVQAKKDGYVTYSQLAEVVPEKAEDEDEAIAASELSALFFTVSAARAVLVNGTAFIFGFAAKKLLH